MEGVRTITVPSPSGMWTLSIATPPVMVVMEMLKYFQLSYTILVCGQLPHRWQGWCRAGVLVSLCASPAQDPIRAIILRAGGGVAYMRESGYAISAMDPVPRSLHGSWMSPGGWIQDMPDGHIHHGSRTCQMATSSMDPRYARWSHRAWIQDMPCGHYHHGSRTCHVVTTTMDPGYAMWSIPPLDPRHARRAMPSMDPRHAIVVTTTSPYGPDLGSDLQIGGSDLRIEGPTWNQIMPIMISISRSKV